MYTTVVTPTENELPDGGDTLTRLVLPELSVAVALSNVTTVLVTPSSTVWETVAGQVTVGDVVSTDNIKGQELETVKVMMLYGKHLKRCCFTSIKDIHVKRHGYRRKF